MHKGTNIYSIVGHIDVRTHLYRAERLNDWVEWTCLKAVDLKTMQI